MIKLILKFKIDVTFRCYGFYADASYAYGNKKGGPVLWSGDLFIWPLSGSKRWPTFRLDDITNDVIITYFLGHSFTSMVHPHIKLSDHTSKRFIVIVKKVVISFKYEYRRLNLTLRCDVADDVTSGKHTFSGIICNDL